MPFPRQRRIKNKRALSIAAYLAFPTRYARACLILVTKLKARKRKKRFSALSEKSLVKPRAIGTHMGDKRGLTALQPGSSQYKPSLTGHAEGGAR